SVSSRLRKEGTAATASRSRGAGPRREPTGTGGHPMSEPAGERVFATENKRYPEYGTVTTPSGDTVKAESGQNQDDRGIGMGMSIRYILKCIQLQDNQLVEVKLQKIGRKLAKDNYQKAAVVQAVYDSSPKASRRAELDAICAYYQLKVAEPYEENEDV